MAKKPMKFKRYDEGGDVEESKAKQRGLDISNKEEPMGFLQRLRMGNIDDPSSEAYKRFGAGRGRSEAPAKKEESAPTRAMEPTPVAAPAPSARPLSDNMYSDYGPSEGRSSGETVKPTRPAASKPTVPASKPVASNPSKTTTSRTRRNDDAEQEADNPAGSRSMVGVPGTLDKRGITKETRAPRAIYNEPPVSGNMKREEENAPVDETKLSLSERMKLSRARNKSGSGPTDKRSVNERIREKLGFSKGGSVNSASRRADGIAKKGKTKGRLI